MGGVALLQLLKRQKDGSMGYLDIVFIVCAVMGGLLSLLLIHFAVFTVVGIFAKKKYPFTAEKLKYGVIISARNEEKVIGKLLQSIRKCDYEQDKIDVFVVAHNCTDETAKVCRDEGAIVYEYSNPNEKTLGYAYRHLFKKIKDEHDIDSYDGFLILNADNVLTENYLEKMNDSFVACGKKKVVTSFRNSKNFGENYMSCLYGLFFIMMCRYYCRGRTVCGCSSRVSGTGYLLPAQTVKEGWDYVTLTEDWEFSADQITQGNKIVYCDEAEFYDEQPTTVKIMLRQRMRWAKGHMDVFATRFKKLVKSIFRKKKKGESKNTFSAYNMAVEIMPLGVISISMLIIQIILVSLAPLFGYNAAAVWIDYGIFLGIMFASGYAVTLISGLLLFILEHKRISKVRFFTALKAFLLWPFFLMLDVFLDVASLFIKKLEWKPIPHSYNNTHETSKEKKARSKVKKTYKAKGESEAASTQAPPAV